MTAQLATVSAPPALASVELGSNALVLPSSLTEEEWRSLARPIARVEGAPLWWWGDWLNYGELVYDNPGTGYQIAQVESDYAIKTLYQAKWVAGRVPVALRIAELKWGHHLQVAGLTLADADGLSVPDYAAMTEWLTLARDNGWTVAELRSAMRDEKHHAPEPASIHFSSESEEWYTPPRIIAAVVACLGGIDLDPCAEMGDPKTVPARRHFTVADDGLSRPWFGRTYMNPPYGSEIPRWIAKLVEEYETGDVEAAIALVPARTDTDWFEPLFAYPVCFVHGRLRFSDDDGAPFPSALAYLGTQHERFAESFSDLGAVTQFTQRRRQ